jgi:hypothetical protein
VTLDEGAVRELDVLAREVHAAWRDGMLAQGREVAAHRMTWETLSADDHALDAYIAERVARATISALEARCQAAEARAVALEEAIKRASARMLGKAEEWGRSVDKGRQLSYQAADMILCDEVAEAMAQAGAGEDGEGTG